MSAELRTLLALSAFFVVLAIVYGLTAYEPAGTVLLALCAMTTMVAAIPLRPRRRAGLVGFWLLAHFNLLFRVISMAAAAACSPARREAPMPRSTA